MRQSLRTFHVKAARPHSLVVAEHEFDNFGYTDRTAWASHIEHHFLTDSNHGNR